MAVQQYLYRVGNDAAGMCHLFPCRVCTGKEEILWTEDIIFNLYSSDGTSETSCTCSAGAYRKLYGYP